MKYLVLLLILLQNILASEDIGTISSITGDISITRDDAPITKLKDVKLKINDIIETSLNSKVVLELKDETVITLGQNSSLHIQEFQIDKNPKALFNLEKGSFKVISGKIAKLDSNEYKLKTQTADIRVRGTKVIADQTQVACTCGIITVKSNNNMVIVPAGQITNTSINSNPTLPRNMNSDDIQKFTDALIIEK